nr:alkaline phosphatase D family protein [Lysinibacillus timonensis]
MCKFLFPALLAGPMIRRVESTQAFIWVVTSKDYKIHADFYEITKDNEKDHYSSMKTKTETQSIRLGEFLFIHLIRISPKTGQFPTDKLIGYNLHFVNQEESMNLDDFGLLTHSNPNSIIYDSFYIPKKGKRQAARFLFGSCRKSHGEGDDTLLNGDRLLAENSRNIQQRPEALFLMGDQIYADDVPDPLFRPINILGKALMGIEEDLSALDSRIASKPFNLDLYKVNSRKSVMNKLAKFTSGKSSNHLIQYGEYATMYLFSWSPVLWTLARRHELFETFEEAFENDHIRIRSKSEKLKQLEQAKLRRRYTAQEQALNNGEYDSYQVRRLLANIPTYMIFDDHDITDDWNISAEWKEAVQTSPIGRHIVANGLSAYWAFQAWGNQPEIFRKDFINLMESYFEHLRNGQVMVHHERWVKMLWGHHPWHFTTPTSTSALFLDTRTKREYGQAKNEGQQLGDVSPPQLINTFELEALRKQLKNSGWKKGTPLMIISPTPIIGFELVETIVSQFVPPLQMLGVHVQTIFDMEAWRYNGKGLTNILEQLARWKPDPCIILSGDVHYSFSVSSSVSFANGRTLKVKQITSSPIKNMSFHSIGKLVKAAATFDRLFQEDPKIYRYCDNSFQIQNVNKDQLPNKKYLWKDQLSYDFVDRYSIIETENTLSYLAITKNNIENQFLKAPESVHNSELENKGSEK